jgi:fatty acid/phospholipid synthesis protein PlsX/malonyl CoA-acyl carrier protein transacylase
MIRIAVDAMGGDRAPGVVVEGALLAATELDVEVFLVGQKDRVEEELARHSLRNLPVHLVPASQVVSMDDSPSGTVKKKDSSMRVAFELMKRGEVQAVVSAGNSGALMATGMYAMGKLPHVERPAILVVVPSATRGTVMIDAGANTECKPRHLFQFALMGSIYAERVLGFVRPRVGVLSNGEEEGKGTELTRIVSEQLRSTALNYIGYVEGRDITNGRVDVVVSDGFVGNVTLKTMEGVASFIMGALKDAFRQSHMSRLGLFLCRKSLLRAYTRLDYAEYGGAPLLGLDGVAIIAHGESSPKALKNAIRVAKETVSNDVNSHIIELLGELGEEEDGKGEGFPRKIWHQIKSKIETIGEKQTLKPKEEPRVAFVFPGQGSQYVGMGKELCQEYVVAREVFAEAEEALGLPLQRLCFSGPEEELRLTEYTQPAILAVSIAALRVLQSECQIEPIYVAGHSLGEYSALVGVGALDLRDALKIVRERGRLMQEAVPNGDGGMAAVLGLEAQDVQLVCEEAGKGEVVAPANFNGGGQIVIAGAKGAVLRAMALARERGARKVVELPVSAPFHCTLMLPAAEGLKRVLDGVTVHPFSTGVITNVEASVNLDPNRVKSLLVEQVVRPVRMEESIKRLEELGCDRMLEVGPGRVLCGLIKRISPRVKARNFERPRDLERMIKD